MDEKLIHVSGCLQYLFPSDGGRVTVETVSFVQGTGTVFLPLPQLYFPKNEKNVEVFMSLVPLLDK